MSNVTTVAIEIADKVTGHISIMRFVTEERGEGGAVRWQREASDENIETELARSGQVLASITWRRIDDADIPSSRDFRNSWRSNGGKLAVDMPLAREEHMARIRAARDAALKAKDAEWMLAFSRGDTATASAIEAERQALRDVPRVISSAVEAAPTPGALGAIKPEIIKDKMR